MIGILPHHCCTAVVMGLPEPDACKVAVYGEELDLYPDVHNTIQWADVGVSLKSVVRNDFENRVWKTSVPEFKDTTVLLIRVQDEHGQKFWR